MNRRDRRSSPEPQRPPSRKVKEERWSGKGRGVASGSAVSWNPRGDARKTEEAVEASQLLQGPRSRGRGVGTEGSSCQALPSAERAKEGGHLKVIISRGGGSGRLFFCFICG